MIPSTLLRPLVPRTRPGTRTLFKNFKGLKKLDFQEDDGKHHEYSIRPDTFAFKVSGANEASRSLISLNLAVTTIPTPSKSHPLQKNEASEFNRFNLVEFIYKNTTNYPFENKTPQDIFNSFPKTTSHKLSRLNSRPKKVKMLTSDFIEDSLYNPNYGYFSKQVEIFHPDKPFDYQNIQDADEFMDNWEKAYAKYDELNPSIVETKEQMKEVDTKNKSKFAKHAKNIYNTDLASTGQFKKTKKSLQLWHTPTELFQPHYGESLARYILVNYKLNGSYPYNDLIIYEMGGGNGTLMCNVLNYIKENEPDIYNRTQYRIIEISNQLAIKQLESALSAKLTLQGLDSSKFEIINQSIFKWDKVEMEPCFFIALEVFDNFSHDLIRYDNTTGEPHQGHVLVDENNDFYEFFTPELSYYSNIFLNLRENSDSAVLKNSSNWIGKLKAMKSVLPFVNKDKIHPLYHSTSKLKWKNRFFPLKDDLTPGEFIPTRLVEFFHILKHRFPNHSLIVSDFHELGNTIPGYYNGPVVQTIIEDKMIDITTYMSHQGYFDIMFATDFQLASDLYKQITGKVSRVELHHDFLDQWADVDATTTKKGENPMLDFYKNASFMIS